MEGLVGVQWSQSSLWGESASLTLVSHPCSDGVTIKVPYWVDVLLHLPSSHPIFSYWIESDFIVRSVDTELGI